MSKQKITWEQVYQLPLHKDKYGPYAWSENGVMSLMFDSAVSDKDRETIIKIINGEIDKKINGLTFNGCDFFINKNYIFCVRGWGNLTGIGALNLPVEEATKIQDNFINHIYYQCTAKPNTHGDWPWVSYIRNCSSINNNYKALNVEVINIPVILTACNII